MGRDRGREPSLPGKGRPRMRQACETRRITGDEGLSLRALVARSLASRADPLPSHTLLGTRRARWDAREAFDLGAREMNSTQSNPPVAPRRSTMVPPAKTPPPLPRVSRTAQKAPPLPSRHSPQRRSSTPPPLPAAARRGSGVPREDDATAMLRVAIEEAVAPLRARIEELERRSLAAPPVAARPPVASVPPQGSAGAWATTGRQWAHVVGHRIEKLAEVYSYFELTMGRWAPLRRSSQQTVPPPR
jgi:hypothetical protein